MRKVWTKEILINWAEHFYSERGYSPDNRIAVKEPKGGHPCGRSAKRYFNTWNEMLRQARVPVNRDFDNPRVDIVCSHCGKSKSKLKCKIQKSGLSFCNNSCSMSYFNAHKNYGYRRSKLEKFIEERLKSDFPDMDFIFNGKQEIGSELDIFVPSLKLAFELNGIFHYEPIYGADWLNKVQNNDNRKFQACLERGIELCIIDSSAQQKASQMEKFYLIVKNILLIRLSREF